MDGPQPLISPAQLQARLEAGGVLPLDCRVRRVTHATGPSTFEARRDDWLAAHIPGAAYVHVVDDLSDPDNPLPFMLPAPRQVARLLSGLGTTAQTTVVVYGEAADMAAHRAWWVLSASGHPDVGVLDGGFRRWRDEGRALSSGVETFRRTDYRPRPRPGWVSARADVWASLDQPGTCLINALSPDLFSGAGDQVFGRRGHIPGSINLPAETLIDQATGCFIPREEMRALIDSRLPAGCARLIPYCGGGIAACTVALGLAIVGKPAVALYDGSLFDWTQDPDAPMATGSAHTARPGSQAP